MTGDPVTGDPVTGDPDTPRPERLVLLGSVVADVSMRVPALPDRGGDVLASAAVIEAGGGFNILAAASRLGMPTALGGWVGDGPFGRAVSAALEAEGVLRLLPPASGDTGFVVVLVEPGGERTFVTSPGVESRMSAAHVRGLRIETTDVVYLSGYDLCYPVTGPAVATWCLERPDVWLVLDPGPLVAAIPAAVLPVVLASTNVLTLNARELALLAGAPVPEAVDVVRRMLPAGALLLVRDGSRGCTLHRDGRPPTHIPAPEVVAVDSTGAGDTHTGAFLAELSRGLSADDALAAANRAAALSVTRAGSATAPTRQELAEDCAGNSPDQPG